MTQGQISHSFDNQFSSIKTASSSLHENNKYEEMPVFRTIYRDQYVDEWWEG